MTSANGDGYTKIVCKDSIQTSRENDMTFTIISKKLLPEFQK
jgi:hypothetical protein